jgi:hypothetical protein
MMDTKLKAFVERIERLEDRKDEYHRSIGSFADTPLGKAAAIREAEPVK